MTDDTKLRFTYPSGRFGETTWGEFATINQDDPDMLRELRVDLNRTGHATMGGGAAPVIEIEIIPA